MPRLLLALLAGTLPVLACDNGLGPEQTDLERNRALWEETGPSSYSYSVEWLCFCGLRGPARVTVSDGVVVDVELLSLERPAVELAELFPAVDGLFAILDDAFERNAHSIDVTYDPETGVPVEFFIDYLENAVDEELGMRVTEPVTESEGL